MPTQLILQLNKNNDPLEVMQSITQTFPTEPGDLLSSCDFIAQTMTYTLLSTSFTDNQRRWLNYQIQQGNLIVGSYFIANTTQILYDGEGRNDRLVAILGHTYDKQLVDLTTEISLPYGVSLVQRYSNKESESLLLNHQEMHNLIETYKHWLLQHPDPEHEEADFSDHPF